MACGWGLCDPFITATQKNHLCPQRSSGCAPLGGLSSFPEGRCSGQSMPPAHSGGPPAHSGGPPAHSGGPPAHSGGPPAHSGGSPAHSGGPSAHSGGPSSHFGGPPTHSGGPCVLKKIFIPCVGWAVQVL